MVELIEKRRKRPPQIGKIHHPALAFGERSGYVNLDSKGMSVKTPAFMVFRQIGQPVRRLDSKNLENFHVLLQFCTGRHSIGNTPIDFIYKDCTEYGRDQRRLLGAGAILPRLSPGRAITLEFSQLWPRAPDPPIKYGLHRMTNPAFLPLIAEPADLEGQLSSDAILVVDLCKPEVYRQAHIPGAVHLEYMQIVAARPPAMGLLPDDTQLSAIFSSLGMTPDHHVVAYDDEGGGRAARLLWTLEAVGHSRYSLLNGGFQAWSAEHRPLTSDVKPRARTDYRVSRTGAAVASKEYIREHLDDQKVVLLDARTPAEYRGEKRLATRAGHIPGAVNFDWVNAIDQSRNLRLKSAADLRQMLTQIGVTPDKEIITYCQTHHRSAHTFIVLKSLGFNRIAGYPGSWSEWGNSPDTPIE